MHQFPNALGYMSLFFVMLMEENNLVLPVGTCLHLDGNPIPVVRRH